MLRTIFSLLAILATLSACATDCCTPYGYGYYYRPAHVPPANGTVPQPSGHFVFSPS